MQRPYRSRMCYPLFLCTVLFYYYFRFIFTSIDNELIHKIILIIALPVSLYALNLGYKNHNIISFAYIGISGLLALSMAVLLGESLLGESGEKIMTLVGSVSVCYAHFKNHQACKNLDCSSCHD